MEQAAAERFGWVRLHNDNRCDVCPDLIDPRSGGRRFIECKSVGRSNQAIVYRSRMEADLEWTAQKGLELYYCIFCHAADAQGCQFKSDLHRALAATMYQALIFPLGAFWDELKHRPAKKLNSAKNISHGHGSPEYRDGWNLKIKRLMEICTERAEVPPGTVYGNPVAACPALVHPGARELMEFLEFLNPTEART